MPGITIKGNDPANTLSALRPTKPSRPMKNKKFLNLLRYVISFGAIVLILYMFRKELPQVGALLQSVSIPQFLLAFWLFAVCLFIISIRLRVLLAVHAIDLSLPRVYYASWLSIFFNNLLPSSLGGDAVKAFYLFKKSSSRFSRPSSRPWHHAHFRYRLHFLFRSGAAIP